jgi:hypothetical protein
MVKTVDHQATTSMETQGARDISEAHLTLIKVWVEAEVQV